MNKYGFKRNSFYEESTFRTPTFRELSERLKREAYEAEKLALHGMTPPFNPNAGITATAGQNLTPNPPASEPIKFNSIRELAEHFRKQAIKESRISTTPESNKNYSPYTPSTPAPPIKQPILTTGLNSAGWKPKTFEELRKLYKTGNNLNAPVAGAGIKQKPLSEKESQELRTSQDIEPKIRPDNWRPE